jgi:transposase InsO family protein
MIRGIFWEHRRRYGARRIAVELAERGQPCSRRRVSRLMKEMELAAIQPKSFKTELEMRAYSNERIARKEIPDYIRYYNTRRRHSALEYLTPEEFETSSHAAHDCCG